MQAPINPSDVNQVQGKYPIKPPLPAVAGNEGVARVIEVGPEVLRLCSPSAAVKLHTWCCVHFVPQSNVGTHLFQVKGLEVGNHVVPILAGAGTWRQRATFAADALHAVPTDLPIEAAATMCIK